MSELSGKTAVVTGGSGVLGSAMCRGLAQAGAAVAVLGRTTAKTQALAHDIEAGGGRAVGVAVDVVDRASVEMAAATVAAVLGRVDILVNAAGGNQPAAIVTPERSFFDLPADAFQNVIDLNLRGSIIPSQVFGKLMAEQQSGVVVNLSSMNAIRPLSRTFAYSAAKAAIDNFTRWLAVYMAREFNPNIRVNAIAPGFFLGDQNRALLIDEETGKPTARGQRILDHTPMGRFGEPEDLIGTLVWLVSDAARFVTGAVIPVDGGFSADSGI